MVYFTTSSKLLALALLSSSTLVAALPAPAQSEASGAPSGAAGSGTATGPKTTGLSSDVAGSSAAGSGAGNSGAAPSSTLVGGPSGTGKGGPSGTGKGGPSGTVSNSGPTGSGVVPSEPLSAGGPSSTVESCPGPSTSAKAGCTPITPEQVQTIPGWEQVKQSMEGRFGAGKPYNLVTNPPEYLDRPAHDCNGIAEGFVWFNFEEVVEGHYKWATKLEDTLPDEAQRKLKGGAAGPSGISSGQGKPTGATGISSGEPTGATGISTGIEQPSGGNTDLPPKSGGVSAGVSSKANSAAAPSGTGANANPSAVPSATGPEANPTGEATGTKASASTSVSVKKDT